MPFDDSDEDDDDNARGVARPSTKPGRVSPAASDPRGAGAGPSVAATSASSGPSPEEQGVDPLGEPAAGLMDLSDLGELAVAEEAGRYEFTIVCPVCATRIDLTSDQIGQTTVCPDCTHRMPIMAPGPHQQRRQIAKWGTGAEAIERLSMAENDARAQQALAASVAVKGEADKYLERAAKELEEEADREQRKGWDDKTASWLFKFIVSSMAVMRGGVLVGIGSVAAGALTMALHSGEGANFASSIGSLLKWTITVPLVGIWFTLAAAHFLAVFQDSSEGLAEIENWPGADFYEWILKPFYLVAAMAVSGFPGFLMAVLLGGMGLPWEVASLAILVCWIGLLPVVLLSMLHEGSMASVYSAEIVRGMRLTNNVLSTFYQGTALLGLVMWLAAWAVTLESVLMAPVIAALLVFGGFTYFRLLGWLARNSLRELERESG